MDWRAWHEHYDDTASPLARRLRIVQDQIRVALGECPPGPVRVISLCAGQGRDLLEVLDGHPRCGDVKAWLVEFDQRNAAIAEETAAAAGLAQQVEVVRADAALTDHYQGMVPAQIVLVCGLFGNIVDADIKQTIGVCPQLCAPGATVIWTRHRKAPDRIPMICDWFGQRGFHLQWLSAPNAGFGVGVHRFRGTPDPLVPGVRMFSFVGYDAL